MGSGNFKVPQIDEILNILKNGKWHDLREISEKTCLHKAKVEMLTTFLAQYNFIELDAKEHRTRLTKPLFNFMKKIKELEA